MTDLKGKWALVTGASRGVGKEIAIALAGLGCNVVVHSRNKQHTDEITEQLKRYNVEVIQVQAELEYKEQIEEMLNFIDSKALSIDIVYNVAAVNSNVLDFFSVEYEEYEKIFAVNVFAVAKICNHFIPKMIKRGFGRIVNVVSAVNNEPKAMVYGASKAALMKLTKEMAYAVNGTNVMINMADPGWVRTDMGTNNAPVEVEQCVSGMLLGTLCDDGISGRVFCADKYYGCSIEEAYMKEIGEPIAKLPDFLDGNTSTLEKVVSLSDFKEKYGEFTASNKKKVVFGGGNQAKFFLDVFKYLGCDIDTVMCTKRPQGVETLQGIPMYSKEELPYRKDECIVIVALTEQHVRAVESQLKKEGYNVLPSYSVLYTEDNWKNENGTRVSEIYQYKTNTFTGKGIGK